MTEKEILLIQVQTDVAELRKDQECGLYDGRKEEFFKEIKRIKEKLERIEWECPECGEIRKGDDRVKAGMKCFHCAY